MNNLPLAFLMGLLGSLHCAVMCGPLMLSLPLEKSNYFKASLQLLLYQFGRVLTYTLMGLALGWLGNSLLFFTNQQNLGLIIGIVLIVFAFLQLTGQYQQKLGAFQANLVSPISKLMGKVFGMPLWGFFAGLLNGLIPCGMVYLALATALNTATVRDGGMFMFLFGLGTVPLMLLISLGGIYLKKYIRFNSRKLVPWFMLFMGLLFALRAANLGIPFLSPDHSTHAHAAGAVCR